MKYRLTKYVKAELANAKKQLDKTSYNPCDKTTDSFGAGFYTGQIRILEVIITKFGLTIDK